MEMARVSSAVSGFGESAACGKGSAGARRLGLGVLLAFTLKGIVTTAAMVMALLAVWPDEVTQEDATPVVQTAAEAHAAQEY